MSFSLRKWLGLVMAGSLMSACEPANNVSSNGPDERPPGLRASQPVELEWSTRVIAGGVTDDSTLQVVIHPVANERGVFLADLSARRITHIDHQARRVWQFGKSGAGPGEFQDPRDIRLDAAGRVWVLDPRNSRITVIDPDGKLYREINLQSIGSRPVEVIPLSQEKAVVVASDPRAPFVVIDSLGSVVERREFPWRPFSEMSGLATQLVSTSEPTSDFWVTGFRVGDGFFFFDGERWTGKRGWFAEPIEFPVPVVVEADGKRVTSFKEKPLSAARSMTMSPTRLYVLFGGASEDKTKLVHEYRRSDGAYERSFLLPEPALDITWHDGGLYVLRENPYPEIAYLRIQGGRLD